jgi:hypothetical protein
MMPLVSLDLWLLAGGVLLLVAAGTAAHIAIRREAAVLRPRRVRDDPVRPPCSVRAPTVRRLRMRAACERQLVS